MKNKSSLILLLASGFVLASCNNNPTPTSSASGSGSAGDSSAVSSAGEATIATGAKQFVDATYEERTEILGKLEKYAVDTALTGLPLFENGGYNMVSSRVVKGTETYIPNYGFSTFRDGRPNGTLSGETDETVKNYYHTWESSDPQTVNGLDAQGSQVLGLHGDIQAGFFGTRLNKAKTGYEWYGVLSAKDRPLAVEKGVAKEANATELHETWRVYVRTGEKGGVMYRTGSKLNDRKAFDGTYAKLEDYINAFQVLLTGKNNYYRGSELSTATGSSGFVGAGDFFTGTKEGFDAKLWDRVGIQGGTDTEGDYIDFSFLVPTNRFYAMYNVAPSLYCPIPADFYNLVTNNGENPGNYASYNNDKSTTPVDNILSVGSVYLEDWKTEQVIKMKVNRDWWEIKENPDLYRWDGITYSILTGYTQDKTIAFKEYLAGKLDSVGIPQEYLKDYRSNPLTAKVPGSSVFKLNMNTCTEETWEELFGTEGEISPHASETDYWEVKPWMSNNAFIRGLFYSIDRQNFAETRGSIPSINYFSDAYLSNPEEGISYNSTAEHAAALDKFWGTTVSTYGYSEALAIESFKKAINELIEAKAITEETEELKVGLAWMYDYMLSDYGNEIIKYMEGAFNKAAEALGYDFVLKVDQYCRDPNDYEDVYNAMMAGEFDIAFGSISGNSLNPINFLEVLKSDNSSGFTLNWGQDTSVVDTGEDALIYKNEIYSFDGLWAAADTGVILDEAGNAIPASDFTLDAEKSYLDMTGETPTMHLEGNLEVYPDPALKVEPYDFFAQSGVASDYFEAYEVGYADYYGAGTTADPFVFDPETGNFSVTIYGALVDNISYLAEVAGTRYNLVDGKGNVTAYRWGLDCYKYIDGVYLGIESPCHVFGSDFIKWILPEEEPEETSGEGILRTHVIPGMSFGF